ncbi:hypothetical protein [Allocoleopsis sp.]|uniref:hypothetical protein n=1 Tax=Allocoleopsis sp. TaxID=3088169 RepID=UPI002FD4D583
MNDKQQAQIYSKCDLKSSSRWRYRVLLFIDERSAESSSAGAIALFIDRRSPTSS